MIACASMSTHTTVLALVSRRYVPNNVAPAATDLRLLGCDRRPPSAAGLAALPFAALITVADGVVEGAVPVVVVDVADTAESRPSLAAKSTVDSSWRKWDCSGS